MDVSIRFLQFTFGGEKTLLYIIESQFRWFAFSVVVFPRRN